MSRFFTRDIRPLLLGVTPYSRSFDSRAYGPLTLFGASFQTLQLLTCIGTRGPTPHISVQSPDGFGLAFSPFSRPYLGNRFYFLFLPVLGCFRSRCSLTLRVLVGLLDRLEKSHSDILSSKATCASPRHFAACRVLLRLPAQGIHRIAYRKVFGLLFWPFPDSCGLPFLVLAFPHFSFCPFACEFIFK